MAVAHCPPTHASPAPQGSAHAPQWPGSVCTSTHWLPQRVPAAHPHSPLRHVRSPLHALPHAPQCGLVGVRVDARPPAPFLATGGASGLALAAGAGLPGRARTPAAAAVLGVGLAVDAGGAAARRACRARLRLLLFLALLGFGIGVVDEPGSEAERGQHCTEAAAEGGCRCRARHGRAPDSSMAPGAAPRLRKWRRSSAEAGRESLQCAARAEGSLPAARAESFGGGLRPGSPFPMRSGSSRPGRCR